MTISMSQVQTIRQLKREGESIAEIGRRLGVSRDTVYKYLKRDDFSPAMPVRKPSKSILDEYRPVIEGYLDEDARSWHKQRHTARRIFERLRDEHGCTAAESTVRHYVAKLRRERETTASAYLTLVWAPGEAQADFGEADFYLGGVKRRLFYLVVTFPFSNVGIAQVFRGQNAECVCQGLKNVFEFLGGVPNRVVFDNATGVGRKITDGFRTTALFSAFATHYGFDFAFCNPDSGHEKGNVENKVGFIRRNLFVPTPHVTNLAAYNKHLMPRCLSLSENKPHWSKGEPESQLFIEDQFAMAGLPEKEFQVIRWETLKTDRQGRFRLEQVHIYSTSPELARTEVIVGIGADVVSCHTTDGRLVCEHERAYGDVPTDSEEPASQLALLCVKAGAWKNSQVRASLPERLRAHMDGLGKQDLKSELRIMRNQTACSGYAAAVDAMEGALEGAGRIDEAGVAVAAARAASGAIVYDEPVDLGAYDRALSRTKGA